MDKYDLLLCSLIIMHLMLCPFTKVEESFNLQATHDIMEFGVGMEALMKYDHIEFPGVVPRTFIGPLLLSAASWPTNKFLELLIVDINNITRQYVSRFFIGMSTAFSLSSLRSSVAKHFGRQVSAAFGILNACQFHTIFWASRTLPNMFAFPLVILAYSHWISSVNSSISKQELLMMIRYMTFTAVIFRFELVILLAPIVILELWMGRLNLFDTLQIGIVTGVASLVLSCLIDSYFWQKQLLWPEGYAFYFNGILGKSVEWGVSPFHTYFTSFLPRLLIASLPLSILSIFADSHTIRFLIPMFAFVCGFSFLGHKEWRFIVYVVPIFNFCAAIGWTWIQQKGSTLIKRLIIIILLIGFTASTAMAIVSSHNYPGGVALQRIHAIQKNYTVKVHLDVLTAMTGASRFGQLRNDWIYSKNESHLSPIDYTVYTHLLTAKPHYHNAYFETIDVVYGYEQFRLKNPNLVVQNWLNLFRHFDVNHIEKVLESLLPIQIVTVPKVWIMKRSTTSYIASIQN